MEAGFSWNELTQNEPLTAKHLKGMQNAWQQIAAIRKKESERLERKAKRRH